jgi:hypothetical protein
MIDRIDALKRQLTVAPVMGHFHPLLPLCLPPGVVVTADARRVALAMDARDPVPEDLILIIRPDPAYADRFLSLSLTEAPPAEVINEGLVSNPKAARCLLTNHGIGDRIVTDAETNGYRCVALLLIDGLSYEDVRHWPEVPEPVFVDGPSITFSNPTGGAVLPDVGFPAITGSTPLGLRLQRVGLIRSRGYTYWDRAQNDVADLVFKGIHQDRVSSITEALDRLAGQSLDGMYIQIVRIGTDSLAHGRREVSGAEVAATVQVVHKDLQALVNLLREGGVHGAVYLTSDHGMLWKNQNALQKLDGYATTHPRYTMEGLGHNVATVRFSRGNMDFHLFKYPYIGTTIRANDGGVHGGLSYWESIVPLVRVEVKP